MKEKIKVLNWYNFGYPKIEVCPPMHSRCIVDPRCQENGSVHLATRELKTWTPEGHCSSVQTAATSDGMTETRIIFIMRSIRCVRKAEDAHTTLLLIPI